MLIKNRILTLLSVALFIITQNHCMEITQNHSNKLSTTQNNFYTLSSDLITNIIYNLDFNSRKNLIRTNYLFWNRYRKDKSIIVGNLESSDFIQQLFNCSYKHKKIVKCLKEAHENKAPGYQIAGLFDSASQIHKIFNLFKEHAGKKNREISESIETYCKPLIPIKDPKSIILYHYKPDIDNIEAVKATVKKNPNIAYILAAAGYNFNKKKNPYLYGDLHTAIYDNDTQYVKNLLSLNSSIIDLNSQNIQGDTPINLAVGLNNIDILQCLIHSSTNPNILNKFGYAPIHVAVASGNVEAVKLLLDHPLIEVFLPDGDGFTINHNDYQKTPEIQQLINNHIKKFT